MCRAAEGGSAMAKYCALGRAGISNIVRARTAERNWMRKAFKEVAMNHIDRSRVFSFGKVQS